MAFVRNTLISRPGHQNLGIDWGSGASSVIDFFGAGLKAQGAKEALEAQLAAQRQQQAPAGGISTTTLLIGGAVLAGVLVFATRRK